MNLQKIIYRSIIELKKASIKSADLDVWVLLRSILEKDDSFLITHPEALLTNAQYQKFRRLLRRRKKGEPVAYLVGEKEFYGLKFKVNKNVLIPRPESELIVEKIISIIKDRNINLSFPRRRAVRGSEEPSGSRRESTNWVDSRLRGNDTNEGGDDTINIIDVGTGSGCIIISIAYTLLTFVLPDFRTCFFATDISSKSLDVARSNAKLHKADDQIKFYKSDLLSNPRLPKQLDVIIANLPYIPSDKNYKDIDYTTLSYEPREALFGGPKGYELIEKLIIQISKRNYQPKIIMFEIFEDYAEIIKAIAEKYLPKYKFVLKKDLAGLNRFVVLNIM